MKELKGRYLQFGFIFILMSCGQAQQRGPVLPSSSVEEKGTDEDYYNNPYSGKEATRLDKELSNKRRSSGGTRSPSHTTGLGRLDIDRHLDSTVYIYTPVVLCEIESERDQHKTCTEACDTSLSCFLGCKDDTTCEDTWYIFGSGVFAVSKSQILTNHHVVEEAILGDFLNEQDDKFGYAINTFIETHSGDEILVKEVKWYDENDDVALIELVESASGVFIPPHGSLSKLDLLDELFTIGNPSNIKWTVSKGHLTNKKIDLCNCFAHSIPIGGGNSGGPIFDMKGNLVGLIAKTLGAYDNLNFGPHIDRIKELIRNNGGTSGPSLLSSSTRRLSRRERRDYVQNLKKLARKAEVLE